jgi:hypothetical protein
VLGGAAGNGNHVLAFRLLVTAGGPHRFAVIVGHKALFVESKGARWVGSIVVVGATQMAHAREVTVGRSIEFQVEKEADQVLDGPLSFVAERDRPAYGSVALVIIGAEGDLQSILLACPRRDDNRLQRHHHRLSRLPETKKQWVEKVLRK